MNMKLFGLTETKLFHFHGKSIKGGGGGVVSEFLGNDHNKPHSLMSDPISTMYFQ